MDTNKIDEHFKSSEIKDDASAVDQFAAEMLSLDYSNEKGFEDDVDIDTLKYEILIDGSSGHEFEERRYTKVDNPVSTWPWAGKFDVLYPKSLRGTVNAVKYVLSQGKKLKCLGTRYSFSHICETDGNYLDLSETFKYKPGKHNNTHSTLDQRPTQRLINGNSEGNYINIPAGLPIQYLNHVLCPDNNNHDAVFGHKRLFNMGGVADQTFAGAFSTGTHGTGGKYSALHDMVRSMVIVASDGTVYRVEPEDGKITDPNKHKTYYEDHPEAVKVELIQDDEKFYAALVSMGCFGIIYSVIIEVTEMSNLHQEVEYIENGFDGTFIEKLGKGMLSMDPEAEDHHSIQINPYYVRGDNPKAVSYLHKKTVLTDETEPRGGEKRKKFWPTFIASLGFLGGAIRHLANSGKYPKKRFIESSLKAQHDVENEGGGYTDLSYKVWNGGLGRMSTFGVGIEFAFPVKKLPLIAPKILEMLHHLGERREGYYLNAPASLRFTRPSKAYLANNYYKVSENETVNEWCHFEFLRVNSLNKDDDARELELLKQIQRFFGTYGARPHWGLNFQYEFSVGILESLYPEFPKWLRAYRFFNRTELFSNEFTDKSGIDIAARKIDLNDGDDHIS